MLFSKKFFMSIEHVLGKKNLTKKIFSRKKRYTAEISKKKFFKKIEKFKNLADRPDSAKNFLGTKTYILDKYCV